MAFYSPFFASGLLAPSSPRTTHDNDHDDFSPPVSPMSAEFDEDNLMDVDTPQARRRRNGVADTTPRAGTTSTGATYTVLPSNPSDPSLATSTSSSSSSTTPRTVRRRRSSLSLNQTAASSPIASIRSPQRAAENALHYQRQLHHSRSRSGSIAGDRYSSITAAVAAVTADATTATATATAATVTTSGRPVGGRARSGSLGCALRAPQGGLVGVGSTTVIPPVPVLPSVRSRRITSRRVHTLPAPVTPPPTAPLPALPALPPSLQGTPRSKSSSPTPSLASHPSSSPSSSIPIPPRTAIGLVTNLPPKHSPPSAYDHHANLMKPAGGALSSSPAAVVGGGATSARARGLSVSNSALNGDAHRIDEMKEN